MKVSDENEVAYEVTQAKISEDETIRKALNILIVRTKRETILSSSENVRDFLTLHTQGLEHEILGAMFLDNQHRLIVVEDIFRGTIDGASVYPREVAKIGLAHNAAALILYHNHPSGKAEPSQADIAITAKLKDALALVGIRVLDHVIVGGGETVSLAERGLI